MKKVILLTGILLLLLPLMLSAQVILSDNFSSLGEWRAGYGDWKILAGRLVQGDASTGLARIDRPLNASGEYEIAFTIRYLGGGYKTVADLKSLNLHAGFGIHIAVDKAHLGKAAWGNGRSYLLWLNLDTRKETMAKHPEHYGFRAQVYRSTSNSRMALVPEMNVDIAAALGTNLLDMMAYVQQAGFLSKDVPIRIRVNTNTGRIMVNDPSNAQMWFYFDLPAANLKGNYVSLRTNGMSAAYDDFSVVRR